MTEPGDPLPPPGAPAPPPPPDGREGSQDPTSDVLSGPGWRGIESIPLAVEPPRDPEPPAPPPRLRGGSVFRSLRETLETVLVAVLVVLFTATFVAQNSVIPTASMEDTLLIGDYVLVNRIQLAPVDAVGGAAPAAWAPQRPIERGDVVVFKFPRDPRTDYVKRVIGLPGDSVEIRDKRVYLDGALLLEPYKLHRTGILVPRSSPDARRDNFGPIVVPADSYFVLGDNRDYSEDSRSWHFVPRENVTGRAFVVFWSRRQQPGAWEVGAGARVRRFLRGLLEVHREIRWERIGEVVR